MRAASAHFRETLAGLLDALSNEGADKVKFCVGDLKDSLEKLEQTMGEDVNDLRDPAVTTQIRERMILYQEAASVAVTLAGVLSAAEQA